MTIHAGSRVRRRALLAAGAALYVAGLSMSLRSQEPRPSPPAAPARAAGVPWQADETGADFGPKPPVQALTPEEQAKRFILPHGYRLELVLAEPDVVSPGVLAFDGNGRLYVAELRSYMLDADATNQTAPVSRISRHESTQGDGRYDRHTVFVDNLRTPRMILPLDDDSIITMETDSDDVFRYWDTNGDGVADRRELFFSGAGRRGNLEHQTSGFIWALDNWIYSTYNAFRIRWTPTGVIREPTAPNGGQWGLTQDDYGKVWFVDAGGERGPVNFQTPIVYGAFNVEDQFEPDFRVTWPVPTGVADMQGGMVRIRSPIGVLNHFTATCGQDVFRGHRLPADLRGDLLFAEPVGRLIRRAKVAVTAGLTQLRNAYPGSEFILSSDPLFRPVNMTTAPDGTIYIADMYHGIIQESQWTRPGSYLRKKIAQHQMDKVIDRGRIWRLVHDDHEPDRTRPQMLGEPAARLVAHLGHPNGWWRDTAQKLLVLRQDRSVAPALEQMARGSDSLLARFHAMWTLEGLNALTAGLVRELMKDANPQMRVQAIRASESLYKAGDRTFLADVKSMTRDRDASVVIQAMLTLNLQKAPDIKEIVRSAQEASRARGVKEIGDQILAPPSMSFGGGSGRFFTAGQRAVLQQGTQIYAELCFACHGIDGKGAPLGGAPAGTAMAPSLVSARVQGHPDYVIKTLLHGLTGPVDGATYLNVMVPMGENTDEWIAAAASHVRNSFGNRASFVTAADVARVRAATAGRTALWTLEELEATLPVLLPPNPGWKATASHNPQAAARALSDEGPATWTSGAPQRAGMWYQVELPQPAVIGEVHFESAASFGRPPAAATTSAGQRAGRAVEGSGSAPATRPAGATGAAEEAAPAARFPPVIVGFPRAFKVETSLDGKSWALAAEGQGADTTTTSIAFAPVETRMIRITLTAGAESAPPWSIQRLRLYQPAGRPGRPASPQ